MKKKLDQGTGMMCYCDEGKRIFQPQIFTPYVYVYNGSTFEIEQIILVGGRPMGLAFSPDEKFAYIPNFDLNEIEKLDTKTGIIVNKIGNVKGPRDIAITPDGKLAYVTNVVENTVSVIDLTSDAVKDIIPVGQMPTTIVIPQDGKYAYVSDQGAGFIIAIDLKTNEIKIAIPVAGNPISIVEE